jgi:hypothetical protein
MKRMLIITGAVALLLTAVFFFLRFRTKSFSPESTVQIEHAGATVSVFYCRPYKKGRVIFDGLVPYGKVWRTGANEATVFATTKPLKIGGQTLPAGKYSLWTIPNPEQWTVIFNQKHGQWGVKFTGEINRKEANDVLTAEARAMVAPTETEQFTISLETMDDELDLVLMWDRTVVVLPMQVIEP